MPATKTKKPIPAEPPHQLKKEQAIKWAKERLADPNTVIVDVETTGLLKNDPETKIVSLSMINHKGQIILASLVNPERPIPLDAQKVHHIEDRDVASAMPWSVIGDIAAYQMKDKHIVCYNAGFDVHLMVHLFGVYGIPIPDFEVSCAMEWYSQFVGEWSKTNGEYKWKKLPHLAYGQAHDSLVDCQSTLLLMKKMAGDFSDEPDTNDISLDF
jgi:DNA polymerase III epsilon subunit-like protein